MSVVAGRGSQHVPVVSQRDDVERQVGERNVLAGRLECPAIGQKKALIGRSGVAGRFLGDDAYRQQSPQIKPADVETARNNWSLVIKGSSRSSNSCRNRRNVAFHVGGRSRASPMSFSCRRDLVGCRV